MGGQTTGVRRGGRGRVLTATVVALLTVALTGCSGGGSESGGDSLAVEDAGSAREAPTEGGGVQGLSSGDLDGAGRVEVQTRAVISTGKVELETDDLVEARSQVERILGRFGGYVAREESRSDDGGRPASSTLQLRVPSQHFGTVMGSFAEFGEVVHTGRKSEDVTTEVIDVDSRIRTQEISLERLRTFLGRATKVTDMIRIESEIARREADLASLRAQQDYLTDQTSLATITLYMSLPPEKADDDDPLADAGFLTGLRNGWEALSDATVVGATVAGALLPFVGVLTLVLVPLVLWLRTGRRRRTPVAPVTPSTPS